MQERTDSNATTSNSTASSTTDTQPSLLEQYKIQLERLNGMGFTDEEANIKALEETNGNVNQAVGKLLADM